MPHTRKVTKLSLQERRDIGGETLAQHLLRGTLHQILVDGFHHADPHPCNVLVTTDGKLASLDVGMVAAVPDDFRDKLLRLLVPLAEGNGDTVADVSMEVGEVTEFFHECRFRRAIRELVANDSFHRQLQRGLAPRNVLALAGELDQLRARSPRSRNACSTCPTTASRCACMSTTRSGSSAAWTALPIASSSACSSPRSSSPAQCGLTTAPTSRSSDSPGSWSSGTSSPRVAPSSSSATC